MPTLSAVSADMGSLFAVPRMPSVPKSFRIHHQRADLDARRLPGRQELTEVAKREARVDYVLDDQDVTAPYVGFEVLHDADDPAGFRGLAVGGDGHEVDLDR